MSNLVGLGSTVPFVILLLIGTQQFAEVALWNVGLQSCLFVVTALVPSLVTGRMSYVDIAWPWGLVTIGLLPLIMSMVSAAPSTSAAELSVSMIYTLLVHSVKDLSSQPRVLLVSMAYFVAGLRMGMGALMEWAMGKLKNEFPRYKYLQSRWERHDGIQPGTARFVIQMQKEISVQGFCNMGVLCLPMMIQAFGYMKGPIQPIEIFGWALWLMALGFEHTADMQKLAFAQKCKREKIKNAVCNVGLWNYSRHPNYFGEWMVWNSLIITSIPSLMALWESNQETQGAKITLSLGLVYISYAMYTCLTSYTGAKPAEYYSVQKRPDYRDYQKRVNMFFPGPARPSEKKEK
eukprot:Nk52_evm4s628 gene=Nk52_evmTU4s628